MKKTLFALAVMAATTVPAFANSVDVKVTGTITPDACIATLSNGGVFDYGVIKADTLVTDNFTVLDKKYMKINVTCSAPTKIALKTTSSRPDTDRPAGLDYSPLIALAADDGKKVGAYGLAIEKPIFNGASGKLVTINNGIVGGAVDYAVSLTVPTRIVSFSSASASTLQALTTLSADIFAETRINKASELDLSKEIKIDGLATIELVYL
ncbi:DUF1120 domain-containing protein [Enterobacter cloacae]|uniref:DUF1120 domain-containing protein n=1 Tax=Enterobacter cloacae TaxID=550 RepID=UPI0020059FEF|nr:DUF1120 domain-containing protein [Enterobacter cloacae]MCK7177159.1 DUF1120 domain-containing protein [Enterobacter cloacae]